MNPNRPSKTKDRGWKILSGGILLIVLCALSFYGGISYQRNHAVSASSSETATSGSFGSGGSGGFGRFGGQRPNIGTVTAVSSTSITIAQSFTNTNQTFSITSATTVTNNGQNASVSSIATGDKVLIRASSSDSTQAASIDVNPPFGGGVPGGAGTSSGSSL